MNIFKSNLYRLKELHERFLKRESRQEDIELINSLKKKLAEYEERFRMLKDEKKYFQMELLNRENNFNKVFNNTPNIGIINPLNANTKVKYYIYIYYRYTFIKISLLIDKIKTKWFYI